MYPVQPPAPPPPQPVRTYPQAENMVKTYTDFALAVEGHINEITNKVPKLTGGNFTNAALKGEWSTLYTSRVADFETEWKTLRDAFPPLLRNLRAIKQQADAEIALWQARIHQYHYV